MVKLGYFDVIWGALDLMRTGDEIEIETKVKPENRELFLQAVKFYIDENKYGNEIEFSNDYKKVIKR